MPIELPGAKSNRHRLLILQNKIHKLSFNLVIIIVKVPIFTTCFKAKLTLAWVVRFSLSCSPNPGLNCRLLKLKQAVTRAVPSFQKMPLSAAKTKPKEISWKAKTGSIEASRVHGERGRWKKHKETNTVKTASQLTQRELRQKRKAYIYLGKSGHLFLTDINMISMCRPCIVFDWTFSSGLVWQTNAGISMMFCWC